MKKLISALKQIRIGQILTICLASLLIFVSTACGSGSELKAQAQTSDQVKEEVPEGAETSPLEGGMNEFPDTDPRRDTSAAGSKASSLVEAAEQNITKDYQLSAPAGEKAQQASENVGGAAQGLATDLSKGTQRGLANITGNTQSAAKGAQQAAEDTSDTAKRKTSEATKDIQQAAENVPGQVGGD